jgi:23S rRNA pseudouridine2605 synthase
MMNLPSHNDSRAVAVAEDTPVMTESASAVDAGNGAAEEGKKKAAKRGVRGPRSLRRTRAARAPGDAENGGGKSDAAPPDAGVPGNQAK